MPAPPPFVTHVLELLAPLGAVRARRMFGGHGLYVDALFIALIAHDRLYLKADAASRPAFERAGSTPFAYSRRDPAAVALGYWSAPDEALDSPQAMGPWARLALAAALRAKASSRSPAAADQPATQRRAPSRKTSAPRKSAVRR
ncbi:MAG: TfoX/Sxy family protein [Burkholderiaceae bacterium]|nr:TfoX/Sxy family protein [Burkholderiaceae bacterium]